MKNADKPINPLKSHDGLLYLEKDMEGYIDQARPLIGLTKREYFAGLAMQSILSNNDTAGNINEMDEKLWIAEISVQLADELLKALES